MLQLIVTTLLAAAPPQTADVEAFLRKLLSPCPLSTPMPPADAVYEPELAATAKRVDELAPPSAPDFFDHDIRECGVLPAHPVYSVKMTTQGGYVIAVVGTGTSAVNNKREITFVVVQTADGPRIVDARDDANSSLRAELGQRLNVLNAVEVDKNAAMTFIRQAIEQPTADIYAPSLTALGTPSPMPARQVASVKAGLNQANRTAVLATLSDGTVLRYIVEKTDKGPRIWDSYAANASRVALADARERDETLALTDAEAVAFMKQLFAPYVSSAIKHTPTPYGAGLAELISIDSQLTDGVPYLDGDIICACQEYANFSVESVKAIGHDGQRVRVETNFHTFPDPSSARHAIFIIVKTKTGLRIYDQIHDKEGSVRAQLQRAISSGYAF